MLIIHFRPQNILGTGKCSLVALALGLTGIIQYTNPPSALGFWIALEKCTASNGALSFLPGSHLTTPLTKRFVRIPGGGTGFEPLVAPEVAERVAAENKAASDSYVLETCEPGMLSSVT
jgi:phytanoyl-CoA hydroxylase